MVKTVMAFHIVTLSLVACSESRNFHAPMQNTISDSEAGSQDTHQSSTSDTDSAQSSTQDSESVDTTDTSTSDTEQTDTTEGTDNTGDLPDPITKGYLWVDGNRLRDDAGRLVRLTGVNWFGFETSNRAPHGLWSRDYKSMLTQIKDVGFNAVRIPWSNAIMEHGTMPQSIGFYGADSYNQTNPINQSLQNKTALEVLDGIVDTAKELGLRIILDNHSRAPDGYMNEALWYTESVSEEKWISDWVEMAKRYQGNPTVVGMDLDNEPHDEATWGEGDDATNWNTAAEKCGNAILEVNPDVLILVEGVEGYKGDNTWWGGNLKGVKEHPISLKKKNKLVYSPHEYGPEVFAQDWFSASDFPANMPEIWRDHFGYVMEEKLGYLLVGEFGIRELESDSGKEGVWFNELMKFIGPNYSWTFWCWNPNSGDTGGILQNDWTNVQQWKVDILKPYFAPIIPVD